jgi:Na+/melibiose symporter-like transporter
MVLLFWQCRANGLLKAPARAGNRPLDLQGSALFAGAIVSVLLALTFLGQDPSYVWTAQFWGLLVAGLALSVLFVRQEYRALEPVIDMSLVTRHPFLIVNLYNFAFGACVFGCFTFIPYYASVQYGMSPLESGAVLTPRSLAMIVVSFFASIFLIRFGYRLPMVLGMAGMIVSMLIVGQGWDGIDLGAFSLGPFGLLAWTVGLSGAAMGLIMPSSNNAGIDLLPERVGVISGLRQFFRQVGGMIGTAGIVVALSLSPDQAAGLRSVYTALGLLLIVTIPLACLIPDAARQRRLSERDAPASASPKSPVAV